MKSIYEFTQNLSPSTICTYPNLSSMPLLRVETCHMQVVFKSVSLRSTLLKLLKGARNISSIDQSAAHPQFEGHLQ